MAMTEIRKALDLRNCWLYAIDSKRDLARRLLTTAVDLDQLSHDAGNFRLFSIRQGNKDRAVQVPKRNLQRIHARIHKLLSRAQAPEYLHSAIKGKSYLSNARAHDLSARTIKIDVKKFFPSVPRVAIFEFFASTMKCRRDVAGILADILTFDARLPTGSSASPIIAYYAFKPMFDELSELAKRHGLTMTCYVDDITISGDGAGRSVLYEAHQIIAKYGLKSHKMKVFAAKDAKVITGVCNVPSGERVPNKLQLRIAKDFDELKSASDNSEKKRVLGPLLGRLEAARQIDRTFGARARTLRSVMKSMN